MIQDQPLRPQLEQSTKNILLIWDELSKEWNSQRALEIIWKIKMLSGLGWNSHLS